MSGINKLPELGVPVTAYRIDDGESFDSPILIEMKRKRPFTLMDPDEPYTTLMEREQREAAEVQRRGWSPCSMTSAQWDELRAWSMKEAE